MEKYRPMTGANKLVATHIHDFRKNSVINEIQGCCVGVREEGQICGDSREGICYFG
jgi:hypothetical protein